VVTANTMEEHSLFILVPPNEWRENISMEFIFFPHNIWSNPQVNRIYYSWDRRLCWDDNPMVIHWKLSPVSNLPHL
jgi:hypothetical protein